jgi:hypothetical protein
VDGILMRLMQPFGAGAGDQAVERLQFLRVLRRILRRRGGQDQRRLEQGGVKVMHHLGRGLSRCIYGLVGSFGDRSRQQGDGKQDGHGMVLEEI